MTHRKRGRRPRAPANADGRRGGRAHRFESSTTGARHGDSATVDHPRGRQRSIAPPSGRGRVILYGWHAVKAAIENPRRRIRTLLLTENAARRLAQHGIALPGEVQLVRPDVIAGRLTPDAVHQGLMAEVDPLPSLDLEDLAPDGIFVVLDQVTDPHNVGAVARSAAAFGATAIITTLRHSPAATGVLTKAASGALEHIPIVCVPNLARALDGMKANGVFLAGLDRDSPLDLAAVPLRAPLGLVLGAEDRGLRRLTRTSCDVVARLVLPGPIKSLNVSNAAAIALYVAVSRLGTCN
jgi:23S rRNA (guanosine2251-2'-O)-methyltransferase